MELGTIRQINIDVEMQASYLDYAMSVIVARALPDVRDGLKPVHRRILYAMHDLGLDPDKPYKKSARIVGEVLGKYHPHGDAAVYEAMVRMAQDFSLRYPLVDGQGNFGSIDGDNAAAMRYTEARLSKIATEMLGDIEKDTVEWTDNFDGTLKEPTVLPAALPNLLVNGASGIAVGMATNIPPHNLGEVCDALCYLIDRYDRHDDVTVEDLMQFIPGPDFPTGGVIYRYQREGSGEAAEQVDVIAKAYAGGKGHIVMQAKAHIEDMSRNRSRIVVTELPYQANKTNLLERIAELARDGRLEGLTDLRDESDRTGMRICIEMTRTVEPREVLANLFKLTPLQQTFGVSLLALVDGEPRLLSLKRMLMHFLEHRQEVIVRRSKYELAKAKARAHILEGLLRALDVLDEIIALIRASKTADVAKQGLIKDFKFSEIQAQAILDMQLRRLAALERRRLQDEYREVIALIRTLEELLNSPKKVLALIRQNLIDLKARYGDARRTQIADRVQGTLTTHDLLPDEDVWVTLSPEGTLTKWRRGDPANEPKGKAAPAHLRAPAPQIAAANTRDDLYLFSVKGQATRIGAHQVPEGSGSHFADLSGLTRRDRIAAMVALPKSSDQLPDSSVLLLATVQGKVKRVAVVDLMDQASADPQVIGLDDGDELLWAGVSPGGGEFLLVTAQGQAIRFAEDDVRSMGLPAGGIGGIKLAAKDRVVAAMNLVKGEIAQPHVALITTLGIGKRVPVADFPAQGRNGQGVVAAKPSPKLGNVAGAALAGFSDTLFCLTAGGGARLIPAAAVPEMGRPAQGKSVIPLVGGDQVTRIVGVAVEQSKGKAEVEAKVQAKVEAKAETKTRKTAAGPPEVASTAAKKPAVKPASGTKAAAPTKISAAVGAPTIVGKAAAGTAKPSPAPARKAAAAQPTLLPSEQATPAPKQPAKPAATPQTEPAAKPTGRSAAKPISTAPAAEPAKPTSRSTAKNASTATKTEPIKPAARATTKPAATAPKTDAVQAPARPAAKSEPAAPAEKPAARKVPPEKAGGTSAKPAAGKASGPSSKTQ
jgi:DNA gyrase subunit A